MRGKEFPQKKVLSLVLCVAVMLSVMVMGAGAAFSDQDKIENTEAVNMCTALNIIGGYPDGSYKPEGNIKRSEITKMICVALNGGKEPNVSTNTTPTFSDVRGTNAAWAEGYIEFLRGPGHHLRRGRRPVQPQRQRDRLPAGQDAAGQPGLQRQH